MIMNSQSFCSSVNLKREWRGCYLDVLGYQPSEDFSDQTDSGSESKRSRLNIVSLVPKARHLMRPRKQTKKSIDMWTETAAQIHGNILEMAAWVQKKKWDYVSVNMPDDEASLIESTLTSFIPTTANEIESLRQMAQGPHNQTQQHRLGIVQILMTLLRECVADPFSALQKQRARKAVALWQNPLHCELAQPKYLAASDEELDLQHPSSPSMKELHQRQCFLPKRPTHRLQTGFLDLYMDKPRCQQSPAARLFQQHLPTQAEYDTVDAAKFTKTPPMQHEAPVVDQEFYLSPETLQQESLLIASNHDLDSVQQMEQRMLDITSLLSQFTSLVSEQQEFVQDIYESTSAAKSNVDKGQEELIKAKETVKAGKNYTAKAITAMGLLLLVLHWVRP